MKKKIISIGLILLIVASVFSGCISENNDAVDDKEDSNTNGGIDKTYTINTNYPRDRLGLNENGEAAFSSACNKYSELKESMNSEAARIALVDELNNDFEFVKEAGLSEDGYTIAVIFEDDTAALLYTYEAPSDGDETTYLQFGGHTPNKEPTLPTDQYVSTIYSEEEKILPVASEIGFSGQCPVDFVVPQSKKVLILNALSLDMPVYTDYHQREINSSLMDNGWTKNDIDIKKRLTLTDGRLTPDDFFNCSGYGIIVYMGHGGYCSGYEGSIPGHHYITCCNYVDFTSSIGKDRYDQYLTWRDQGRLLLTGFYNDSAETEWIWEYSIDTDLIMENIKIDPGTIVYMTSCNSYRAADAYLNNDAGCFFGWDYKTDVITSADTFGEIVNIMAREDVPQNGVDALNQISDRTSHHGGTLQIYDNGKDVYLPGFGKLVVQPSSPPSGTSYYELDFSPYGTTEKIKINAGEEIVYDGVSPINTNITVRAKNSAGNTIETSIASPLIQSGENELFTITSWDTYGIIMEADPLSAKDDGIETSTITATLRTWLESDVLEPTGTPISCKEVEFITNLGTFVESEKAYTDQYGKATVELASTKEGIATIRAIVEDDAVESHKTVDVTFGDLPYSFKLVSRITEEASGWNGQNINQVYSWRYWLVFEGTPDVEWYKITIHLNGYPIGSEGDHEEYITDGSMPSVENDWLTAQQAENWTADYNNGCRFYEIAGVDHYSYEEGVTDVSTRQNEYLSNISKWTFEIEPYTG